MGMKVALGVGEGMGMGMGMRRNAKMMMRTRMKVRVRLSYVCANMSTSKCLEYEEVVAAVAGFCGTEIGRRKTLTTMLASVGKTKNASSDRHASRVLLSETASALHLEKTLMVPIELGRVDTREASECIDRAGMRAACGAKGLMEVAKMLDCVTSLKKSLKMAMDKSNGDDRQHSVILQPTFAPQYNSILDPIDSMVSWLPTLPDVSQAIKKCIDENGRIVDGASKELKEARSKIRELEGKIRKHLNSIMSGKKKASFTIQSSENGLMIAVSSGDVGSMIVMGNAPGHGQVYVQPPVVSALNQKLTVAMQEAKRAEDAVCRSLSGILMEHVHELHDVLAAVENVDFAAARARYSYWIQGVMPVFSNMESSDGLWKDDLQRKKRRKEEVDFSENDDGYLMIGLDGYHSSSSSSPRQGIPIIQLEQLHHPLLLARYLSNKRNESIKIRKHGRASVMKNKKDDSSSATMALQKSIPFDIIVKSGTRCIVITGANAGGKTTVLKALGLCVLMSQGGLFIPCRDSNRQAILPWCDCVLADIGDGQSVVASLSTYSGHLTRIRDTLASCTKTSLVLLDELGSGTDPADGAALATSILNYLSGSYVADSLNNKYIDAGAGLTFCTTHIAELASLAFENSTKYLNAAVEVDEITFAPTFRLLWGLPGRSHALTVAERMFDEKHKDIIEDAKAKIGAGVTELSTILTHIEGKTSEISVSLSEAKSSIRSARQLTKALNVNDNEIYDQQLRIRKAGLMRMAKEAQRIRGMIEIERAKVSASTAMETRKLQEVKEAKEREVQRAIEASWRPSVGDSVILKKFRKEGKVVKIKKNSITIQMGIMEMNVQVKDVQQKR